ncbi:hypothetical protein RMR10_012060 [Agrobacterium rosae]|uniref:hypothetical protein n=1 Tax=Agrobacterium rosae TaxID=1972867 RepID=UPI002A0DEACB|nr:hypothetical protein [Agrobacterium rosae]MDX8313362.1 hypothetical protein [Agrobacterium rosae]
MAEKELKTIKFQMMLAESEAETIDDWSFQNRIRSRAEAIRRLCQIGMLVEAEIETIADAAVETMNFVTDEIGAARREYKTLVNMGTANALFTQEEMNDALSAGITRHFETLDRVDTLTHLVLTLYNAILPLSEADTVKRGVEDSRSIIEQANKIFELTAERRKEREENRYIAINVATRSPEDRAKYEALSEEEQEKMLDAALERLRAEEEMDPHAFHEKHDHKPFWEADGWLEAVNSRGAKKD